MLEKGLVSKYDLYQMNRAELIEQVTKLGIPLPSEFTKKDLVTLIGDARPPEISHAGVITIARMIKFQADLGKGTGGAYDFLKIIYPKQLEEDTLQMARTIDVNQYDA